MTAHKLGFKIIILVIILLPVYARAQKTLIAEGSAGNLYITHTASAKENFYSVGRLYNISPREIAPFNKLTLEQGISIGQTIKIPLMPVNFMQTPAAGPGEVPVPIFHKMERGETLNQISTRYNNVPVASLKEWNNLSGNEISPAKDMIIGYLKVKKDLSPLAQKGIVIPAQKKEKEMITKKEETAEIKVVSPAATVEVKTEPVKIKESTEINDAKIPVRTGNFGTGIFSELYTNTGKKENGMAGVFKSTSGWIDGKFYCLHNASPAGSVIKIINPATGKFIYAKVLDVMPDLKQNNDLTVLISNSAADAVGAGKNNFNCIINY